MFCFVCTFLFLIPPVVRLLLSFDHNTNNSMATDIMDKDLKNLRNQKWDKAFSETQSLIAYEDATSRDDINRKATIVIEHLIQAADVSHTMQHWHVSLWEQIYTFWASFPFFRLPSVTHCFSFLCLVFTYVYLLHRSIASGTNDCSKKCIMPTRRDGQKRIHPNRGTKVKWGSLTFISSH